MASDGQIVSLPWSAWYEETTHDLRVPESWTVDRLEPNPVEQWSDAEVADALSTPIESLPLRELAAGRKSACIAVDDLARPTRAERFLPTIIEQLNTAGVASERITIVVATGTHGPLSLEQIRKKVGTQVASDVRVECHDACGDLVGTGIMLGKLELRLNRTFMEAEMKIVTGSVLPHSFAGYSGGAKAVLPGLADVEATARSHKFVQMGLRGGTDPNANRFRTEAEEICRTLGVEFAVCVVPEPGGGVLGLAAGDLVAAHRRASEFSRKYYATPVEKTYDCLILNAYPKDIDLVQAENCLVALATASRPLVREDGVIVLATAASEGLGRHGLFQPGGFSYHSPRPKRSLGGRALWIYAPGVTPAEAGQLFWKDYPHFADAATLHDALAERFSTATAAVLPSAPMQQVRHND